jgi:hypothetical protein
MFQFSQIIRRKAGSLGNARQHFWAYFLPIVKSEDEVRPTFPGEDPMRSAALPFDDPTNVK